MIGVDEMGRGTCQSGHRSDDTHGVYTLDAPSMQSFLFVPASTATEEANGAREAKSVPFSDSRVRGMPVSR